MEIKFQSKEDSNQQQREAFLKLAPIDRFYAFLDLSERMQDSPSRFDKDQNRHENNFLIEIQSSKHNKEIS